MAPTCHANVTCSPYATHMDQMKRFAVYFAPRPGCLADATAALLGWNSVAGCPVSHPDLPGLPLPLADLTTDPRKYGFHGTIRAPFRLAPSLTADDVAMTVHSLSCLLAPVRCDGLRVENLHGFLALTPEGDTTALNTLAEAVVRATNPLRAALSSAERDRRRPERLTDSQRALLDEWGYPYVMHEFQFHLTLTNCLADAHIEQVACALTAYLGPTLPKPFVIEDLCVFGEDMQGRFHLLHRFALSG